LVGSVVTVGPVVMVGFAVRVGFALSVGSFVMESVVSAEQDCR
jgi:hypothetical protein